MTYRYKTRTRLPLNTGYRAGHTYDKAHARQQQQQRRVTQTLNKDSNPPITKKLENYIQKIYPIISIMPQYNINQTLVQYTFSFFLRAIYEPTKNKSS